MPLPQPANARLDWNGLTGTNALANSAFVTEIYIFTGMRYGWNLQVEQLSVYVPVPTSNIRPGLKGLPGTNVLAYFASVTDN